MQVHLELSARYPDADITVTRDHGHLADLSVVTHGFAEQRGVLTTRAAVWSDVWDLIGPYGRYRRPVRGGIVRESVPVVVVRPERGPDAFAMLVEDVMGDMLVDVDADEVRAVMRSGFGVMA